MMQKYNPTITVLMRTYGSHTDMIGEAIESFLRQTYDRCKLLIVNTHPDPFKLDKDYDNIEIINIKDEFNDELSLNMHCLNLIETDTWTILDDDDIMMPWSLSTLVYHWNANATIEGPMRVCNDTYTVWFGDRGKKDNVKQEKWNSWWNALFSTLSTEEIAFVFHQYRNERITGSDTWLVSNSYFTKIDFHSIPLYIWRRHWGNQMHTCFTHIGTGHISREEEWMNFWKNKQQAFSKPLPEYTTPHWDRNYADSIWKGVVCS